MTCTDAPCTFVIGQDLEKYSGKFGQIISGKDTTNSDFYAHFDIVVVNVDGQMVGHLKVFFNFYSILEINKMY